MKAIVDVEKHFCKKYKMKDLGCVHGMLGWEVLIDEYAGIYSVLYRQSMFRYVLDAYLIEVQ